jgi:hypothetical protein
MSTLSGKQAFQTIKVIHMALMIGLILFSIVVMFLITSGPPREAHMESTILLAVAGAMTIMSIFLGPILYKQQLGKLHGTESLQLKMAAFQTAHIVRSALIEVGGLFGAIICIVSWGLNGLVFTAISIGMFILKIPNSVMLKQDLRLTSEKKTVD